MISRTCATVVNLGEQPHTPVILDEDQQQPRSKILGFPRERRSIVQWLFITTD